MEMGLILAWLAVWAAFGAVGRYVALAKRRRRSEGLALGFLLGPVGVLIEAVLPTGPAVAARRRPRRPEGWQAPYRESPEEIEAFNYLTEGRREPPGQV